MASYCSSVIASEANCDFSLHEFWSGIKVWVNRPHIINRKLIAIEILETWCVTDKLESKTHDINTEDILRYIQDIKNTDVIEFKKYVQQNFNVQTISSVFGFIEEPSDLDCQKDVSTLVIQFRNLLPKNCTKWNPLLEILIIDCVKASVLFFPVKEDALNPPITPLFPYQLCFQDRRFELSVILDIQEAVLSQQLSLKWLTTEVFPKVFKWCQNAPKTPIVPSLNEVSAREYSENYNRLKLKYGKKLVEVWPECTDPTKFVYEDIAIAAYLVTLWEEERKSLDSDEKQSFVDLGCGNGLLVHILSSEGYPGVGIDVRKRKIWEFYGPETKLLEKTIVPSDNMLFPEYDWIIGNHSDELTPWIPVIAARSSFKMRVFLLPCCCYTFNGKYDRIQSGGTRYQSYLAFIRELCEIMGFNVLQDRLRIPSTKRVCFICPSRNYNADAEESIKVQRTQFIDLHSKLQPVLSSANKATKGQSKSNIPSSNSIELNENHDLIHEGLELADFKTDTWVANFQPREKTEVIRNCSTLDAAFIQSTLLKLVNILLRSENFVSLKINERTISWNSGDKWTINDMAKELGPEILQNLKSQFGGLQTLLRNHRNIFSVDKGCVSLSIPSIEMVQPVKSKHKNKRRKGLPKPQTVRKPCFFFCHHPQGCPLSIAECKYSHTEII